MSLIQSSIPKQKNISTLRKRAISESLCRSAMLLLCSNTEKFFESIVFDVLSFHESNKTLIASLPAQLKVTQILRPRFSDSWSSFSAEKSWNKIEEICRNKFTSQNEWCENGLFALEPHTRSFVSPKSNNVAKLFSGIGIENIWEVIGNEVLKKGLDSFVSRRDIITHEGLAASSDRPTTSEVIGFIRDICRIVIEFNKIVSEYLIKEFGTLDPWSVGSQKVEVP